MKGERQMFEKLLSDLKEKYLKQEATISKKIKELESKKAALQKSLDSEFDKQVQAELTGKEYSESKIKNLNTELIEITGRNEAYRRQKANNSISMQDKEVLLKAAAGEYRKECIERLERLKRQYELDKHIRELIEEAERLDEERKSLISHKLFYSGFFPEMNEEAIMSLVSKKADITNDKEFQKLNDQINEFKKNKPSYRGFIWWNK